MKKSILFLTFIFFLGIINSSAQWDYITWTHTGGIPGTLGTSAAYDVIFGTNSTQQMILKTSGNFGIGGSSFTPLHLLDVDQGDIDVNTSSTRGYMIGGANVLYIYGQPDNIFTGYLAGSSSVTGQYNTVAGYSAGNSLLSGTSNTLTGAFAGTNIKGSNGGFYGLWNTVTGYRCGYYNQSGFGDDLYGKAAAYYDTSGYRNCIYGNHAAYGTGYYSADSNCFFGYYSVLNISGNHTAENNVIMGFYAGNVTGATMPSWHNVFLGGNSAPLNPGGNDNIVIGYEADAYTVPTGGGQGSITNAVAIGADAVVNYNNEFILGNNAQDVGIGMVGQTFSASLPKAKLNILQTSGATGSIGLYLQNNDPSPLGLIVPPNGGLVGFGTLTPAAELDVDQPNGGIAIGGNSSASGTTNMGVFGIATNGSYLSVGLAGIATGTDAAGVYYEGVYGECNIPGTYNDCAGVFVGNVYTTGGGVSGTGWLYASDSVIKRKVNSFSNAISIIKKLQPRTYYFDSTNTYNFQLDTFMHYGFIAQQVKRTVPCMVRHISTPPQFDTGRHITVQSSTINALDYNQFAAILTAGFQEQMQISFNDSVKQKQTNDTLRATNDSLRFTLDSLRNAFKNIQSCLNSLCGNSHAPIHHTGGNSNSGDSNTAVTNIQEVTLSALSATPLLYQNTPNPFSTGTKINYYLPSGTMGATIVFYDTYGNLLKTVQLTQTGNGAINITPDNLTSGIYSYSLVVNNNVIDTKRMLLQK
jgi:hypothetical protein